LKLLLDTHVWLWALSTPEKLSRSASKAMARSSDQLYVSSVSVWEVSRLLSRKRLNFSSNFEKWLADSHLALPVLEAPVNWAVAEQASNIHLPHPDFGDTFLAATAIVFEMTLVTADEQLLNTKWLKTIPAR
jgi:PIN domain nuclease of toxin-antitoxin system